MSESNTRKNHLNPLASIGGRTALVLLGCLLFLPVVERPRARAAEPTQADRVRKTILVLGDSLAAGFGLDPSDAFPALLQKQIDAAGWSYTVVNAGVSGNTSADGLGRIAWLLKRPVDVLILELGGNDGLRGIPVETTRTNLQAIIDRAREKRAHMPIVLAGMRLPPQMGTPYTTAFHQIFSDLARSNQTAFVPFLLEGVGGRAQLNQSDGIHPTKEGQKIVAANVWKELKAVLEKMNAASP